MGTFADISGDRFKTIPEEKKPECLDRALTVLREDGICNEEVVSLFGKRFSLVKPAEPDEDGQAAFDYSAHELDYWEWGCLDMKDCGFVTNKIGWSFYNQAVCAVLVLAEQYTNCLALENDLPFPVTSTLGWLNNLFGTEFSDPWAADPERAKLLVPEYKRCELTPRRRDWTNTGVAPKITTEAFFDITEAERFYLWKPDDGLSTEAEVWFTNWRSVLDSVVAGNWETETVIAAQRRMVYALASLPVPAFSEMFYDFFMAAGDRRVQAMIRLLEKQKEQEKREVGRLLSALGSRELHKRFFDL